MYAKVVSTDGETPTLKASSFGFIRNSNSIVIN